MLLGDLFTIQILDPASKVLHVMVVDIRSSHSKSMQVHIMIYYDPKWSATKCSISSKHRNKTS